MPRAAFLLAGLLPCVAIAEDEFCASCNQQVSISGSFKHRREGRRSSFIGGTATNTAAFREEINGTNFAITITRLPAGRYTLEIGEVDSQVTAAGERLFDVTCGAVALAKNYDIFTAAGGAGKICAIIGAIEHEDDTIKGPVTLTFTSSVGLAKFNTVTVKKADGTEAVSFAASDLADEYSTAAKTAPQVAEPAIWRDPSHPMKDRINDLIRRMSLAEKVSQIMNTAPSIPRLGVPAYDYWSEALHGVCDNGIATVFPEPIGGACSWDTNLYHQEAAAIGIEGRAKFNDYAAQHNGDARARGGLTFWSPNVNIFRDPRWGRGQETYGEDPYLTAIIGIEFVKGLQGDDPTYMLAMGCAKHYAVHSGPEGQRHRFNAEPSERDLYETYLPQFEALVREAKVGGVMGAYSALNGVPACASTFLLDDLLRKQWGFDGYICSDCGAIDDIWQPAQHHYVKTAEEAAAVGVKAGCDLCCGREYNSLVKAAQQGLLTEKDINAALYHTLWTRFRLGLFDPPEKVPYSKYTIADNDTPEHQKLALEVARESLVLLKNAGILPLDRSKLKRLAVIGANADSVMMQQGNYNGTASRPVTIIQGIRELATNIEVTYSIGCPVTANSGRGFGFGRGAPVAPQRPAEELKAEALSNAANADLIIYVGGITPQQEGESRDRAGIELPQIQEELIQALHKTGKPVVMVNCSGSAVALPWEAENLPAILQAWYPGEEGGRAVAEALFGALNPSGHLTITFYRATADLPAFTNYSMANRTYKYFEGKPLWAFGHGLSYTKFDYKNGKLASDKIDPSGSAKVTFAIENTGVRDGGDVAQVYFRHVDSAQPQAKMALCGFARVNVNKGASKTVTVDVPAKNLRYWDPAKKQYVVEPGKYEFLIGAASDDIRLRLPFEVAAGR